MPTEEVVDAILNPRRLSIELPVCGLSGLAAYASLEASEVDERGWLEVLNYLYETSERSKIRLRPFESYVREALARGLTKKLAFLVETSAVELGEDVGALVEKYVAVIGYTSPIRATWG